MNGWTSEATTPNRRGRGGRWWLAATIVVAVAVANLGSVAGAAAPPDRGAGASVFAVNPSLAIDAARTRLSLFVRANPPDNSVAGAPCPLASTDAMNASAAAAGGVSGVDLRLGLDAWTVSTRVEPQLRRSSTPNGGVGGTTIVTCDAPLPTERSVARASVFAIPLGDGVSFDDVARVYGIEPILAAQPAALGGQSAGTCLSAGGTGLCVNVWRGRDLAVGFSIEGPAAVVTPDLPGPLLDAIVVALVDEMAVQLGDPVPCDAATLHADTGVELVEPPTCSGGWAVGTDERCPPPPPTTTAQPGSTVAPPQPCTLFDVFQVLPEGWKADGVIDTACAENLAEAGMTGVTAQAFTPACNSDASVLGGGSIRPGRSGRRVAALQTVLVSLGYELPVDGRYGPLTQSAVIDYQTRNGLTVDGIAGSQTQRTLGI